jgi:hypothetical protein
VRALEQDYPGRVQTAEVDAVAEPGFSRCKAAGFGNHGLIAHDETGERLAWMDGHDADVAALSVVLEKYLGQVPQPRKPAD